jgi:hypothetical protein
MVPGNSTVGAGGFVLAISNRHSPPSEIASAPHAALAPAIPARRSRKYFHAATGARPNLTTALVFIEVTLGLAWLSGDGAKQDASEPQAQNDGDAKIVLTTGFT